MFSPGEYVLWHPPLPNLCPHFLFLQTDIILAKPRLLSPWGREWKHFLLCAKKKKSPFVIKLLATRIAEGAFLAIEWLRIYLLMQGTQVRSLVLEHCTCLGATKPVSHNCGSPRPESLCSETEGAPASHIQE